MTPTEILARLKTMRDAARKKHEECAAAFDKLAPASRALPAMGDAVRRYRYEADHLDRLVEDYETRFDETVAALARHIAGWV